MNLCSDDHEEVCFVGGKCPACEVIRAKNDKIKSLAETNNDQLDIIFDLEREIKSLKEQLP